MLKHQDLLPTSCLQIISGEDTSNDVLLAAMLQNEIDSDNLAAENHRNGNCKVTMSSFSGIPRQLGDYEELSEMEENSYFGM